MQINKRVLYVSEAASLLCCSAYQIYKLIHENKQSAYKDEGSNAWKIPEESIHAYVEKRMKFGNSYFLKNKKDQHMMNEVIYGHLFLGIIFYVLIFVSIKEENCTMENPYDDLITVDELCEILLVSRSVAYRLLSSGQIKCFRINRKWKIPRSSVYQYISDQCNAKSK